MFTFASDSDTQKQYGLFSCKEDIDQRRKKHNQEFIAKYGGGISDQDKTECFLSLNEERFLLTKYEINLQLFCKKFEPPMPKCVFHTSIQYFKRFYLHNSSMKYHPGGISMTCTYIACKVKGFHISMDEFIANIHGDKERARSIILSNELIVLRGMKFHLKTYSPYDPIEKFLNDDDVKASLGTDLINKLLPYIDEYIDMILLTDACLLFTPFGIALTAVGYAEYMEQGQVNYSTRSLREVIRVLVNAIAKFRSHTTEFSKFLEKSEEKLIKCEHIINAHMETDSDD